MMNFSDRSGRIFAVWTPEKYPTWDDLHQYDASPDGLLGNKEGFYFADRLIPFILPYFLDGMLISPETYPACMKQYPPTCDICSFFPPAICPILKDRKNIDLSIRGFCYYQKIIYLPRVGDHWTEEIRIFDHAKLQLESHGRALHYEVLARIVADAGGFGKGEKPKSRNLQKILKNNPIFFRNHGDGVFDAISGRSRAGLDTFLELTVE